MEYPMSLNHQFFQARQPCVGLFGDTETLWCLIKKKSSFLQVIYLTTHWLRSWAILQRHTLQDKLVAASHFLEQVAKDFFTRPHGWRSSLRIDSHQCVRPDLPRTNSFQAVCWFGRGRENFKTMYHLDVLFLKSIKFPFSKKNVRIFLLCI